jgi:hypothetical protein
MPFDLMRSRARGTINKPGPLPSFGPVTQIDGVLFDESNTPHRCILCGRRDHPAVACTYQVPD